MTLRILLVEDEFLVAVVMEEALRELACEVVGPIEDLEQALMTARVEHLDGALLDINLGGRMVYPVAELLQERDIPFAFATGYSGGDLPARFRHVPRIAKPANLHQLRDVVTAFGRSKGE